MLEWYVRTWQQGSISTRLKLLFGAVVAVLLIGWLISTFIWLMGLRTAWNYSQEFAQTLSLYIPLNQQLLNSLTYLLFLAFVPTIALFFSFNRKDWKLGFALLAIFGVIFYGILGLVSQKFLVSPIGDAPIKCVVKIDGKNILYDIVPGRKLIDPVTSRPCIPVTDEVARAISRKPPVEVQLLPEMAFFDGTDGTPRVWYSRSSEGKIRLFDNEGHDPSTGQLLKPITLAIVQELKKNFEQELEAKRRAKEIAQKKEQEQKLAIERKQLAEENEKLMKEQEEKVVAARKKAQDTLQEGNEEYPEPKRGSRYSEDYQSIRIGCKKVAAFADEDKFILQYPQNLWAIRLHSDSVFDIRIRRMHIYFQDRSSKRYVFNLVLNRGGRTGAIRIDEPNKRVAHIVFDYAALGVSLKASRLCVEGVISRN